MWASLGMAAGNQASSIYSAERQMAFQKETMKHRYQWMVGDLKKAGLNPMLAIGGASPPSGAQGASSAVDFSSAGKLAESKKQGRSDLKTKSAQQSLMAEQQAGVRASATSALEAAGASRAQANKAMVEKDILNTQLTTAKAREAWDKTEAGQQMLRASRIMELMAPMGAGLGGAILGRYLGGRKGSKGKPDGRQSHSAPRRSDGSIKFKVPSRPGTLIPKNKRKSRKDIYGQ